jgi:phosphatidylglycerol:prolipoprotein diacylglycerol transferase
MDVNPGEKMYPVLFKYGFVEIRFYGLMYVVAIIFASFLIKHEVRRRAIELTSDEVTNFIIWVTVGGVVGARLYYVLFNPGYYMAYPAEIPAVWHGGLAIHGGLIGGFITAWVYLKRHNIIFWQLADAVAPVLILGQAFGRFGNFMNGDAHGRPTEMPWGIVFPPGSIAGTEFPGIALHPAMLYELVINFAIFFFLWFVVRKRAYKNGFLMASYIILYSVGRFFVEHFRADSLMLGPLKAAQTVSIAAVLVIGGIVIAGRLWEGGQGA